MSAMAGELQVIEEEGEDGSITYYYKSELDGEPPRSEDFIEKPYIDDADIDANDEPAPVPPESESESSSEERLIGDSVDSEPEHAKPQSQTPEPAPQKKGEDSDSDLEPRTGKLLSASSAFAAVDSGDKLRFRKYLVDKEKVVVANALRQKREKDARTYDGPGSRVKVIQAFGSGTRDDITEIEIGNEGIVVQVDDGNALVNFSKYGRRWVSRADTICLSQIAAPGAMKPNGKQFGPKRFNNKTRLCRQWQMGRCSWGTDCKFAHDLAELRQAQDQKNGNHLLPSQAWGVVRKGNPGQVAAGAARWVLQHRPGHDRRGDAGMTASSATLRGKRPLNNESNDLKERTKIKRMKGQSAADHVGKRWKSETEMHLRDNFDQ